MTNELIQIELRLMILRHGRSGVLESLAALKDQSVEELEQEIANLEARKRVRNTKVTSSLDIVKRACADHPEKLQLVATLVSRYENRTFLPQLRDAQRFLDRLGSGSTKLKSRRAATAKIATALSQRSVVELEKLCAQPAERSESDFAVLAREIMGGGTAKARQARAEARKTEIAVNERRDSREP